MPTAAQFAFDENGTLDDNIDAFFNWLAQCNRHLTYEMKAQCAAVLDGSFSSTEALDRLFALATRSAQPAAPTTPASTSTNAPQPAPPTSQPVTGWLLDGIAVEGFRGINNQGKPLELKFHVDKVNSISAVNGVGKSSVYDAVRYAISGKLQWLEDLPAADRTSDYYLNKFNTSGKATITLNLIAEPTGQQVAIRVERNAQGGRSVSSVPQSDAVGILKSLNREFVLLDGRTFQSFISAKPLDRGRTFSGLLGLAQYSVIRQSLAAIANTRAFNNHFDVSAHAQALAREQKCVADTSAAIAIDFLTLVGAPIDASPATCAQLKCHGALAQIGPLKPHCDGKVFMEIDVEQCIEAVKASEGGPKRDRLSQCIREQAELGGLTTKVPTEERAARLIALAHARDELACTRFR